METAGRADSTASFGSARPLDALLSLAPLFQVDAFVKAAKAGKGLAGMLGLRKSPVAHPTPGSPGSAEFSLDDLMHFTSEPIPTSLVKMSGEHASRAVKMFAGILKYQGETGEALDEPQRLEIAQKLLHQGLKRPELKDELYMQLLKQTRGNPDPAPTLKAWELFSVVAATMPPSKDFLGLVSEYIHAVAHDEGQLQPVRQLASRTWNSLKRSAKSGPRRTLPSTEELDAMFTGRKLATSVFFLDDTFEELRYDVTTSVLEAVEQVAGIIGLQNYSTFTVFECRTLAAGKAELRADVPQEVEHALLDDNKYIADILCEAKSMRSSKEGYSSKLLFKKRMFRETDESITEPMFINLSYVQAQHDYLQVQY
ncbi:hypothetical protein FOA52_001851 [Chlamydomonas sp. UWO 241]|nr:hypothetical protein FOA52_001851 [Chlamydomonas sp. UWO 241]